VNVVPSTVFGLAAHNGADHLAEALESLLTQTRSDLAIVVVDDCSTDSTGEIARRYAELDARVGYVRNERRLGLVRNWRRAFAHACELHPQARYFAWASDHDVWGSRWLERLAAELDAHPEAALAYPLAVRVDDAGSEYPTRERPFETAGVADPRERLRRVAGELRGAGEMVYGLMRRSAVEAAGPFPLAVLADRLFLVRLALEGEFRQVRERLWYRRFRTGVTMSNKRQRRAAFPDGAPLVAFAPWWLGHPVLLARETGSTGLAAQLVRDSLRTAYARKQERVRRELRWRRRRASERLGLRARPPAPAPTTDDAPRLERGADVLELGASELRPAEVALSVGYFDAHGGELAAQLHELGVPELYSVDHESASLRKALGRYYWLRRVWIDSGGRKPDPVKGPVPLREGELRHLVGRRRLLPETQG
jgi:hypothetical protein